MDPYSNSRCDVRSFPVHAQTLTVISSRLPARPFTRTGRFLHTAKKKSTDYPHWWIARTLCYSPFWWRKRDIKVIHFSLLKVV